MADKELSDIRRPGWGHPLSLREIAKMFGVSPQRVYQLEQIALQKLRQRKEIIEEAEERGIFPWWLEGD